MENFLTALTEHWGLIAGGLLGAWAIFKVVAKFTKTKKDDAFVAKYDEDVENTLK